ncbi:hypothetical protein, partial [Sutterella parvirubra]|uniref:hypothetical protein n=1 Tax=Sutterella parvirubra TaxID=437898 RepID=UPI001C122926
PNSMEAPKNGEIVSPSFGIRRSASYPFFCPQRSASSEKSVSRSDFKLMQRIDFQAFQFSKPIRRSFRIRASIDRPT